MEQKPKIYFENLNGLRFICFLSVFLFHSFRTDFSYIKESPVYSFVKQTMFGNGNLGVNFFFVLSGFLITYLLLKERELFDKIDVVSFWKRRVLRVWPLFYFCIFFGFLIFPFLKSLLGQVPNETAQPIYYLTFLNNFDFIENGPPDSSVLGVLWSVAIEEQFYLAWPILLSVIPYRFYPYLFAFIILGSITFRVLYDNPLFYEYHTFSCIGDMAVGSLGAWLVQDYAIKLKIERLNRIFIMGLYGLVISFFFFRKEIVEHGFLFRVLERPAIAIILLLIILEQCYSKNSLVKLGNFKAVSALGKISYGLYCLHFIGILIITNITKLLHMNTKLWQVLFLETGCALLITILMAKLSYRFLEMPFLKLKNKYTRILTS
jgi:peptidoglycan/LPS O-acetylase OafA/YrhL